MKFVKTPQEIEIMRDGGKRLAAIRDELLGMVEVGQTPIAIDTKAQSLIAKAGGSPSFMTVDGYKWATCISVNDGVVHGVPNTRPFEIGDVVGLDIGMLYEGYHTDTSWTKYLPHTQKQAQEKVQQFLNTGELALKKAIAQAVPGNYVGHISKTIQDEVEGNGYFVVPNLVGHGIGKVLHEAPQIPGVLTSKIEKTPRLEAGMVIAIEVIYTQGTPEVIYPNDDGWTLASADGSLAGLFEETVLVSGTGPVVLTKT